MADRRCLHKKVVESDAFYKLSDGAQALYTHLCMNADDDGFVNNAESITVRLKAGKTRLNELVEKRFVLKYDDVYVIKHWRIGNSLKNDRKKPPTYPEVASKVWLKPNRAYTDHPGAGYRTLLDVKYGIQVESEWNPNGIQMESQPNRTEPNRTEPNRSAEPGEWFMVLRDRYPENRRGNEAKARAAFEMAIRSEADFQTAQSCLEAWLRSDQWTKDYGQYVPYMSNWFDRDNWRSPPPDADNAGQRDLSEEEFAAIRRMMEEDYA